MSHPLRSREPLSACLTLAVLGLAAPAGQEPVHHALQVRLEPERHAIEIADEIRGAPLEDGEVRFRLHADLDLECLDAGARVSADEPHPAGTASGEAGGPLMVRTWRVSAEPDRPVRLAIRGALHHPIEAEGEEYARSFSSSPGIIDAEGVVLSGASWWLPTFDETLATFEMSVDLPEGWDAVSQGERGAHRIEAGRRSVTWTCPHPMEEVYLIAARFHEFSRAAGGVTAYAFLREDDEALASRYLEVTAQYIDMYRQLIGPYPFAKFALVENFWETGYGMPSFTLLGPTVIRLPFILHSSYPHEILHNWWGNGVYVDWESGNWCEGLTAYLADHLIKEGRGEGQVYRRDTLNAYKSYVQDGADFPLTEFRSRHSSATQAVGYGKSLMLWHMLRLRIGDERFRLGLQRFWRGFRFRQASFGDLRDAFSEAGEEDLGDFFAQWVERTGAPVLEARVELGEGASASLTLRQTQAAEPYQLLVPVAVTRLFQPEAELLWLSLSERERTFDLGGDPAVLRVDVDPLFDLFRRLDREEIPPTLAGLFGAEKVLLVAPAPGGDPLAEGWLELARQWRAGQEESIEILTANALGALPEDRAVWILGSSNRWSDVAREGLERIGSIGMVEEGEPGDLSFAFALRHPADPELCLGWVGSGTAAALPGLARKLPHYGKYSYLRFEGDEPTNTLKGQWSAEASPLVWTAPGMRVERGLLPEREALASLAPVFDPGALMAHVEHLAGAELEGRGSGSPGAARAAEYVAAAFAEAGLEPGGDPDGESRGWFQTWSEPGGPEGRPVELRNAVGILRGTRPEWAEQSIVVGAHYDHLGRGWPDVRSGEEGEVHPGADDNASGVSVLIELAGNLARTHRPERSIVFVAFGGEEWGLKGSRHFARTASGFPIEGLRAMVNLDTVGRLGDKPIAVFGSGTASEWKHIAMGIGFTTGIASQCVADDPGGSDQVSFHEARVPAVQIFSGAHADYHRPTDTPDEIDSAGLVTVASFVREMAVYLTARPEPLSSSFAAAEKPPAMPPMGGRRVSFGTMPDFAFGGPGVRVSQVMESSSAEEAGVLAGDVLLAMDGQELADLAGYSALLRKYAPGDRVRVRLRRGEEILEVEATLKAR